MHKKIILKKNQELLLPVFWLGDEEQISYDILLSGENSKITLLALLIGKKTDKLNIATNIVHKKPNTHSKIIVKGALNENAFVNFDGLVRIEKGAKGTNAWLGAHILLLSDKAKGRAVPSLEILENDIKAGHAATVGRVNDLELFYLMSRGLSKKAARSLIVHGFLESLINEFPKDLSEKAREKIKTIHQ